MIPTPINLRRRFGRRFRVRYEPAYEAEYGRGARVEDPRLMIIPCKYGHFYPFGGDTLAASVDGHPNVAGVLRRLPCCRVHQDGDFGELTVVFDVSHFPKIAKIMRPRRRRRLKLSREQRQEIGQRLRQAREGRSQTMPQSDPTGREAVPAAWVDSQALPPHKAMF